MLLVSHLPPGPSLSHFLCYVSLSFTLPNIGGPETFFPSVFMNMPANFIQAHDSLKYLYVYGAQMYSSNSDLFSALQIRVLMACSVSLPDINRPIMLNPPKAEHTAPTSLIPLLSFSLSTPVNLTPIHPVAHISAHPILELSLIPLHLISHSVHKQRLKINL